VAGAVMGCLVFLEGEDLAHHGSGAVVGEKTSFQSLLFFGYDFLQ